jgi:putative NADH-flavin reductase
MRIAIYGGTGMIGSRVATEAASRGHEVTAISRSGGSMAGDGLTSVAGDAGSAEQVAATAAHHDVVVAAIGPSRVGGPPEEFLDAVANLIANVGPTRLVMVGGASSLLDADGHRLLDSPDFPDAYKSEARVGIQAFEQFLASSDVNWTYLSPAPEIAPGERTGRYVLGDDSPAGASISAEDYAVALVDEIERPAHDRRRFTVASVTA